MAGGDAGFGDVATAMAEALRSGAGQGWSVATLQVQHTEGSVSGQAWTDVHDCGWVDFGSVAELLWGRNQPPVSLEVRLFGSGEFSFACADMETLSPDRVVFDPAFRYPGHPLAGMPRPTAAEPTGARTDPAVLAEITRLTNEFAALYAGIKGHAPPWADACTEEELAAAEARIGARLPEDLRALYRVAGGDPHETGLLGQYSHNDLGWLVGDYLHGQPGSGGWDDDLAHAGVVFETMPFGSVKRLSRNDWRVTFGGDRALNYLAVDLDPAERGRSGQVIEYGRDIVGPPRYVSGSITDMLTEVVAAVRAGRYEDPGKHYLHAEVGFPDRTARSHSEVIQCAVAADVPAMVSAVPEPELIQEVYLNDPSEVDLAVFEPLTSLRLLKINRAQAVIPSIGGLGALESLQVSAARIDPTALAGHPTLWDLQLDGITEPVDASTLRTLPRLTRLNLSRSVVSRLRRVSELPSLRVLKLDAAQVRQLIDGGQPLPRLAALYVTGKTHLHEMARLANAFRHDHPPITIIEFSATLP